jgi:hypothetical protein
VELILKNPVMAAAAPTVMRCKQNQQAKYKSFLRQLKLPNKFINIVKFVKAR